MLCEQLEYNLLFRWFVGLGLNERAWVPTVFTKNRDRLLRGDIAEAFFQAVVREARHRNWLSDEHFTVDGTLLEAWASQKSLRPKDELPPSDGTRNPDVNFRGEKRSNEDAPLDDRSGRSPRQEGSRQGVEAFLSGQRADGKTETGSSSIPSFCIQRVRLNVRQPWRCRTDCPKESVGARWEPTRATTPALFYTERRLSWRAQQGGLRAANGMRAASLPSTGSAFWRWPVSWAGSPKPARAEDSTGLHGRPSTLP